MLRNIAAITAVATAAFAASPCAHADTLSYGGVHPVGQTGPYATNPGPYGGYAPTPYSYRPYGGLITSDVAYSFAPYYGSEYGGGPYSGPYRTDSAPLTGGGY